MCQSGYEFGDENGYTCVINRDLSRYVESAEEPKLYGCNYMYDFFSIGIKDWDSTKQICASSFTKEPFFGRMVVVVSVVFVMILVIFISIIKTEKSKPLVQTDDYAKQQHSFSGLDE